MHVYARYRIIGIMLICIAFSSYFSVKTIVILILTLVLYLNDYINSNHDILKGIHFSLAKSWSFDISD